ncbi:MAG: cysteine desulfurase [bacterium]|nr:cysteine desulfurase [bacterium]
MLRKRIYLDYAALTPIDRRVIREMKKYSSKEYGNPSSLYVEGVKAKKALIEARTKVASFLHAHVDEIVFTSGGTEANVLALDGSARAARIQSNITSPHIIISAIEHSSIIETASMLEKFGCEVTRIPVDHAGVILLDEIKKAMKPNTVLISIMTVNNELGSIQPIREITKLVRQIRKENNSIYPLLHTDAAQAALYQDLNVEKLGVDLLTLDSSKVSGPRGLGCLYIKRNTPIEPIMHGGGQEGGMRSGTENVPAIKGFAKALELAVENRSDTGSYLNYIRAYFIKKLTDIHSGIQVNGSIDTAHSDTGEHLVQSPHILNVSIPGIDNEFFVLQLDAKGIACSTKSSCLHDEDESYVMSAIAADSATTVRFSFGSATTKKEIDRTTKIISKILNNMTK